MIDTLQTGPPNEEAAARSANQAGGDNFDFGSDSPHHTPNSRTAATALTPEIARLIAIAQTIMPHGVLRKYLRREPPWCRRAGEDAFMSLFIGRPDPTEIDLLLKAEARALARRDRMQRLAEQDRQLHEHARRISRGERVPPGALDAILGIVGPG